MSIKRRLWRLMKSTSLLESLSDSTPKPKQKKKKRKKSLNLSEKETKVLHGPYYTLHVINRMMTVNYYFHLLLETLRLRRTSLKLCTESFTLISMLPIRKEAFLAMVTWTFCFPHITQACAQGFRAASSSRGNFSSQQADRIEIKRVSLWWVRQRSAVAKFILYFALLQASLFREWAARRLLTADRCWVAPPSQVFSTSVT